MPVTFENLISVPSVQENVGFISESLRRVPCGILFPRDSGTPCKCETHPTFGFEQRDPCTHLLPAPFCINTLLKDPAALVPL